MIYFVSRWLGGYQGAAKSGWDSLGGIHSTGHDIRVIAQEPVQLPRKIGNRKTTGIEVFQTGGRLSTLSHLLRNKSRGLLEPLLREPKIARVLHRMDRLLRQATANRSPTIPDSRRPSLVVVNSLGSHDLFLGLQACDGVPAVLIVRESPGHYKNGETEHGYAAAVTAMQQYSAIIFVSSRCRDAWLQETALRHLQTFYIPNCCQEEEVLDLQRRERQDVRREFGFAANRFVVTCVASLQRRKGQDLIVGQLPALLEAIPNIEIHLIGPDTRGYGKQLRTTVESLGLTDRVRFHGASDKALAAIYASDVCLLPTRAEAMPRVILEAMALATPVVATNVDGIPEIVEHGQTGWLFSPDHLEGPDHPEGPGHPEGMVDGLRRIARDPACAAAWAQAGQERYWRHFSRERLNCRYAEATQSMINLGNRPKSQVA